MILKNFQHYYYWNLMSNKIDMSLKFIKGKKVGKKYKNSYKNSLYHKKLVGNKRQVLLNKKKSLNKNKKKKNQRKIQF